MEGFGKIRSCLSGCRRQGAGLFAFVLALLIGAGLCLGGCGRGAGETEGAAGGTENAAPGTSDQAVGSSGNGAGADEGQTAAPGADGGAAQQELMIYEADFWDVPSDNARRLGPVIYGDILYYLDTTKDSLEAVDIRTKEVREIGCSLEDGVNPVQFAVGEDGALAVLAYSGATETAAAEEFYELVFYDASGNETARQEITEHVCDEDAGTEGRRPAAMALDREGRVYLSFDNLEGDVAVFDRQGQFLFALEDESRCRDILQGDDGVVYGLGYEQSVPGKQGFVLCEIDPEGRAVGEVCEGVPDGSLFYGGRDGEFVIGRGNSLYSYDREDGRVEELTNLINCGVDAMQLETLARLSDGRLAVIFSYEDVEARELKWELACLTAVPASEAVEKTVLTYGTVELHYVVGQQILKFNRESKDCLVLVKEYGKDGESRLTADIIAGNVPDILDMGVSEITSYMSKGLFADLYGFMENDPEMGREAFTANALGLYEQDGKLYGIAPSYCVETLVGRRSVIGERTRWTAEELKEVALAQPAGTHILTTTDRERLLALMLRLGMDMYIDWDAGECHFDDGDFAGLLEFVSMIPSAENMERRGKVVDLIQDGELLLYNLNLYRLSDYLMMPLLFGEPVVFVGYPCETGSGSFIDPVYSMGISASSQNPEAAWTFVRSFLEEEYQENQWYLPLRESALEKLFEEISDEEYSVGGSFNSFHYELTPAGEEDVAAIRTLIETARGSLPTPAEISRIVEEEAGAFFAGQRSAQDVAALVQNRVQLYVDEQR